MSVEAMAPADTGAAVIDSVQNEAVLDKEMAAVWDKHERDNGAARGEGGRFSSANATDDAGAGVDDATGARKEPLEGGEGEAAAEGETSTQSSDVPLPSNWQSPEMKEAWAKVPADLKPVLAAHDLKLRQTLSHQGQQIAQYKPVGEVLSQYPEYFGGERGNYKPEEAVNYLFSLQRSMDDKPFETLMEIADRYSLVPLIKRYFSDPEIAAQIEAAATPGKGGDQNMGALQAEISQLKRTITELNDPDKSTGRIKQVLEEDKLLTQTNKVIESSRSDKSMPLFDKIAEPDLIHFINRAWETLGTTASQEAVLRRAYDQAVNADPDLRKQAAAINAAATNDPKRVADARRANEANITSTATGKHRELSDDELLGSVFDKHKKG